jgi:starch synthase
VLNGIDYEEFNPETDPYIIRNYGADSLDKREKNKRELQSRFGLDQTKSSFVIGIVSRLSEQKGFDLLFPVADVLLRELKIQLVVLGTGEGKYMGFFQELEQRYPGRVGTNLVFDAVLPHVVFAGADAILIPSKFEPAGLVQLEAMRYGATPIVRKTGGLADTVKDHAFSGSGGTGFVFKDFDSQAMMIAITRAFENFQNKTTWRALERRMMAENFSWDTSAKEHAHLFDVASASHKRDVEKDKN